MRIKFINQDNYKKKSVGEVLVSVDFCCIDDMDFFTINEEFQEFLMKSQNNLYQEDILQFLNKVFLTNFVLDERFTSFRISAEDRGSSFIKVTTLHVLDPTCLVNYDDTAKILKYVAINGGMQEVIENEGINVTKLLGNKWHAEQSIEIG